MIDSLNAMYLCCLIYFCSSVISQTYLYMLPNIFVWWLLVQWHAAGGSHGKKSEIVCWHDDQILIQKMLTIVFDIFFLQMEESAMKLQKGSVGGTMIASKFLNHKKVLILPQLQLLRIHLILQHWSATFQGLTLQLLEMCQRNALVSNCHVMITRLIIPFFHV